MTHLMQSAPHHAFLAWMIPALFIFTQPVYALDCVKAISPINKAICADPTALATDEAMTAAYLALYGSFSELDKKQLIQSQRAWINVRANFCGDKNPSIKCLVDWTQRRGLYLQGKPESGPGTGHDLIPVIAERTGTGKLYEFDVSVLKFATPVLPGEKLFNKEVDKLLPDSSVKKEADDPDMATYSFAARIRVTYASPQFISTAIDTYSFTGGAHGIEGTNGININVAEGKLLAFDDVFRPEAKAKLTELCLSEVEARKEEKGMDGPFTIEEMRKTIEGALMGKFDRWFFTDKQATANFHPYELGSYAEGSYECAFATDVLHPLYKVGSVLP